MEVVFVQYVLASGSLDTVGEDSQAVLYGWGGNDLQEEFTGTLKEVNEKAKEMDSKLAEMIEKGEIDGIMFVSADPDGVNEKATKAAAKARIPMAGTGGSGVARIQNAGCNVLSASGTTGTTNRTRAVAFTTTLAKNWGIRYMPVIGNTGDNAVAKAQSNIWKRINFRGIMMTSLPAFIAMALCLALSKIPALSALSDVFDTLANVIMPKQKGEAAVALPGCLINICFGTFVEAAYPFMFSNKIVFGGALASATISGALVGLFDVKGTAYVPAVMAPFMANEGKGLWFAVSMLAAMGCAFVITMIANMMEKKKVQ